MATKQTFIDVVNDFVGDSNAESDADVVNDVLSSFKLHFLHFLLSHLDQFP